MSAVAGVLTIGGLGVVFAGASGAGLLKARRLRGSGVEAQAVVLAQQGMPSAAAAGSAGTLQAPVLLFTTREGRTIRVTSPVGSNQSMLLPGQTVTVYYDPADPTRVSIPQHETGVYRILLAAGLLMLALLAGYGLFGDRMENLLIGIPLFLGLVFSAIGWFGIGRTFRLKHGGGKTGGVVVGSITLDSNSSNGLPLHHPVVRYQGPNGETFEVPSAHGSAFRPPPPGTSVRVCYDRKNPQLMVLAHQDAPAVFWVFGIIGIPVAVIGAIVVVAAVT